MEKTGKQIKKVHDEIEETSLDFQEMVGWYAELFEELYKVCDKEKANKAVKKVLAGD